MFICLLSTSVSPPPLLASEKAGEVRGPKPRALCGHQNMLMPHFWLEWCLSCLLGAGGLGHCWTDSAARACCLWTVKVNV